MKKIKKTLSAVWFIHFVAALGLLALYGYLETDDKCLLLLMALSFSGAMCGAFHRVIDAINNKQ